MAVRRERNEFRSYALVRLYLDDVEEIERALADLGPALSKVEVSNGDWEAETVAELAGKGEGPFSEFSIRRYGPGLLSFETRASETRVYVSDADDLRLRGAFEKIDSVVRAGQRPWYVRLLYSAPAVGLFGAVGLVALAVLAGAMLGDDEYPGWVPAACLGVAAAAAVGGVYLTRTTLRWNGLVYLVPRSARPNFLQRNRDALGMLVIGGVFGSALTLLVDWLTD